MAEVRKLEADEVALIGTGLLAFLGSFLPWLDVAGITANAWSDGFFPTFTWAGLAGLAIALLTALPVFTAVTVPAVIGGFTLRQVRLVLSGLALLLTTSYLIAVEQQGSGLWLSILASIGLFAAAVWHKERPAAAEPDEGSSA